MSEQEVDHSANIIKMVSDRDDKIRELTTNYREVHGEKVDLQAELNVSVIENKELRLELRRTKRLHSDELALREERIRELTGFCNEETQAKSKLRIELDSVKQKSPPAVAVPFTLQLVMASGIAHYHAIVAQCAAATVNRGTNKVSRELRHTVEKDFVVKHPSLHRVATRMCNQMGVELPSKEVLMSQIKKYVVDNIDLYMKDPQYDVSEFSLRQIVAAKNNAAHYGAYGRDVYQMLDWLPAITADLDDIEDDYNDLVEQSVYQICRNLIIESFS